MERVTASVLSDSGRGLPEAAGKGSAGSMVFMGECDLGALDARFLGILKLFRADKLGNREAKFC